MDDYYSLLGINENASARELKRAFRERAKRLHPDIAGKSTERQMRRLLAAYQALSNPERRFAYNRAYRRFSRVFDYPEFLREQKSDPASQAKLVFFLLLHPNNDSYDPLKIWTEYGGLSFSLEKYLGREDWMDCAFLLAEELDRQGRTFEAFSLLVSISKEELRQPYFKHFMEDVRIFLMELAILKLKPKKNAGGLNAGPDADGAADRAAERYAACLELLLNLGFPQKDEIRILRSLMETLAFLGEHGQAESLRLAITGLESAGRKKSKTT